MNKTTALRAIREHCLLCFNGSSDGVANCADVECPLYAYRRGTKPENIPHRPTGACRCFCVEQCKGGVEKEVRECDGKEWIIAPCPLFRFRMGRNPNISQAKRDKLSEQAQQHGLGKR